MPKRIEMVGLRYSRLLVVSDRDSNGELLGSPEYRLVVAKCDCGNEKIISARSIRKGHARSCGCLQREAARTHGLSAHPLYQVLAGMKTRCYSISSPMFKWYGARGISVCDEWKNDMPAFVEWGINNGWEKGLQIDRINNDGDYTSNNCQFVTAKENANNTSRNVLLTIKGERLTISQAADKYGLNQAMISQRIGKLGWSDEDAVTKKRLTTLVWGGVEKPIAEWAKITGISLEAIRRRIKAKWVVDEILTVQVRPQHFITFNGETKNITEWSRFVGISEQALRKRIYVNNWGVERALTERKTS